ncbi:MAG: hypothetical protein HeimAB125_11410 [Candidatus Heimdallarchaeota archaeon AB_125]|nr:MAG: hypothetical protein HeimAB125_11410 [Candidatus Heimdallarchaeota archaeon AB_125]
MIKGINRRFFLFLLGSILLLSISIPVTFTILKIYQKENSIFLMEINNGIEGSFFFEPGGTIHLPYVYYDVHEGYYIGWTQVLNNLLGYKTKNYFLQNPEYKQISFFSSIRGIKSVDDYYYFFVNGEDGFFRPGTVGQRSKDLMSWETFPSFNNDTSSVILKTFIGTDADSQGNLYSCFSDAQGFVLGFDNYSFNIVTIENNNWQMENITFEGELSFLGKGYFTIYDDNPVICWNFYNSSLDLVTLNLAIKNGLNIWNNYSITYPNQDLSPIGFHKAENKIEINFSGYSYYGVNHPSNSNQTTLYRATYSNDEVLSEILFTYPEEIHINENCFHQWNNGSISLFFESFKDGNTKTYYGIISNEDVVLTEIVYNSSTTYRKAHQFEIVDDKIYLLWNEHFRHPTDYNKDYSKLYLGIVPLDYPLDFTDEIIDYTVEWLKFSLVTLSHKQTTQEEPTSFRSYD